MCVCVCVSTEHHQRTQSKKASLFGRNNQLTGMIVFSVVAFMLVKQKNLQDDFVD